MTPATHRAGRVIYRLVIGTAAAAGLLAAGVTLWLVSSGISARPEPGDMESSVARRARHLLIPAQARNLQSPEPPMPERVQSGLEHFADHCAGCHANDGSGDTSLGRSLYPRAPDMRLPATQDLSDGELFYIIQEGVRLTGMPGWGTGTPDGERASWHLVFFIRSLPRLTPDQLDQMRALNPRSAEQWRQEEEERRFLVGRDDPAPPLPTPAHESGGSHR